jgi:exosortase
MGWLYWPIIAGFAQRWDADPQYSHGPLIPFVAMAIVWVRGIPQDDRYFNPSWAGLPLLAAGLTFKFFGSHFYFEFIEAVSLIPTLAGTALMLTGRQLFKSLWPAIVFLIFMMPLPYQLEMLVLQPLQNMATTASTFSLQTLGFSARHEGNVVWIGTTPVGIAEACSGLRMLTGFVALAAAASFVVATERWKRLCLLLSAIPVALVCNVVRVTTMGIVHAVTESSSTHSILHDLLGWLMPVGAAVLIWGELFLLDQLLITEDEVQSRELHNSSPLVGDSCSTHLALETAEQ